MLAKRTGIYNDVLEQICKFAKQYNLDKVILFGSRARGDFKQRSDIDLAVSGGNIPSFSIAVDEETSTLLKYDIINLDKHLEKALIDNIKKDDIILYEKI